MAETRRPDYEPGDLVWIEASGDHAAIVIGEPVWRRSFRAWIVPVADEVTVQAQTPDGNPLIAIRTPTGGWFDARRLRSRKRGEFTR